MIELEVDGKKVSANPGTTILEVALREGRYVPHFCYHKKLSIAANCRMCLVEVEKSAKPLPACATPVTEGMKVHTTSKLAVEAQKGVMEFLLINHPLDCPICDQGGECQLQDLAVGYGKSASRFTEEKRAVANKDLGPLVSTAMTRCIHCSRCIRFTDEIGGSQELGMSYRNNHVEVMPFIGKTVNSEISGNIIDICPVGALLSKPFKNSSRSWELSRRKSIAPHDGLGSNLIVQVDKYHRVVRVLPRDNEAINECWISDRDRFSYEGLYHEDRALKPMIKQDGVWINVSFETALEYATKSIAGVKDHHGSEAIGVLASATSTTEELYLLQKLMFSLKVNNLDYRLAQSDFSLDGKTEGAHYLGAKLNEFLASKSFLVIGSNLREEQPLLASRIRQSVKKGSSLNVISSIDEKLLCVVNAKMIVDPRNIALSVLQVLKAVCVLTQKSATIDLSNIVVTPDAQKMAEDLLNNHGFIVLGNIAKSLPNYAEIYAVALEISNLTNGGFGLMSGLANEVGAELVNFKPKSTGLNAKAMLDNPRKCYVLLNTELEHDAYDSNAALKALGSAESVVVMTAYVSEQMKKYADVILPITPFVETAGSFVNMEGSWQQFNGVTQVQNDARPGWKVIRVLANQLMVPGFEYVSIEDVRSELQPFVEGHLSNKLTVTPKDIVATEAGGAMRENAINANTLVRIGTVGLYFGDSIVRRATALQETVQAKAPVCMISPLLAAKLSLNDGNRVEVSQGEVRGTFNIALNDALTDSSVLLSVSTETIGFAGRYDKINIKVQI